jgi:hypothetical protein
VIQAGDHPKDPRSHFCQTEEVRSPTCGVRGKGILSRVRSFEKRMWLSIRASAGALEEFRSRVHLFRQPDRSGCLF